MFDNGILTVSQINSYVKLMFDGDKNLKNVFVSGEISNFRPNYSSGHLYFSLNDERTTIRAVMFCANLKRLRFNPQDGMNVIVRGTLSVYEMSGQYQIYVQDMQPSGVGTDSLEIERIKKKLEKEGLFDKEKKKKIPPYPNLIGVITSLSGAVLYDIKCVVKRRYPICDMEISPVSVQGEKSEQGIIYAISKFNSQECKPDVIILARGGGAAEDLSVFNKEAIARAVANSKIPIISAIGHETDWTICDYVADMRAPTPSVAAELAVPNKDEILKNLFVVKTRMNLAFRSAINAKKSELDYLSEKMEMFSPKESILKKREKINIFKVKLEYELKRILSEIKMNLEGLESRLEAVNPLNMFLKGYVFLHGIKKGPVSVSNVSKGQILKLKCMDGTIEVSVERIRRENLEG